MPSSPSIKIDLTPITFYAIAEAAVSALFFTFVTALFQKIIFNKFRFFIRETRRAAACVINSCFNCSINPLLYIDNYAHANYSN
ncbi:hypothetical protein BH18THE2_BH18THE2_21480 [soil metagenome]